MRAARKTVLQYSIAKANQKTVKRAFDKWRERNGIPYRCDNEACTFHREPLMWCHKPIRLILDHINGNPRDNSISNLRYLCPNCNEQLPTHAGRNRGRVTMLAASSYVVKTDDGTPNAHLLAEEHPEASLGLKVIRKGQV
jgi:hypothetical protein